MKRQLCLLSLLLYCALTWAEAPSADYEFSETKACSETLDPYLTPASLKVVRKGKLIVATASYPANCSASIDGAAAYSMSSVSLALSSQQDRTGPIAGCNCVRGFQFTLKRAVTKGQTIYLVADGIGVAHASAP
jgi:hypothetical protein